MAEGARLESVCTRKGTQGSNPCLSATPSKLFILNILRTQVCHYRAVSDCYALSGCLSGLRFTNSSVYPSKVGTSLGHNWELRFKPQSPSVGDPQSTQDSAFHSRWLVPGIDLRLHRFRPNRILRRGGSPVTDRRAGIIHRHVK